MLNNRLFTLLFVLLSFWSCNKTIEHPNKVIWGSTDYYEKFLHKEYKPLIMKHGLEFEFNEDAQRLLKRDVKLELVEIDEQDKFVSAKGIKLYKNGIICENNILKINAVEKSVELGIEFTGEATEGNHTLYLLVNDNGGLDRIDDLDLSSTDNLVLAHEWVVRKDDVYNPLAKLLFWIIASLLSLLTIAIIITRINNPTFGIRQLRIEYYNTEGELIPPYKNVKIKRCYKIICTRNQLKQSVISRLFYGKVAFVVNNFWEKDICLKPKSSSKNTIRIVNNSYDSLINSLNKGTPTEFKNSKKEKVVFNF